MDKELKEMLTWINDNLTTIATNQALIYEEMKKMEGEMKEKTEKSQSNT